MEELFSRHKRLIQSCADKLCFRYSCQWLREDLVSVGAITLLTRAKDYKPELGATMSTYLYPFLMGDMQREIENSIYALSLSKKEFEESGELWASAIIRYDDNSVIAPRSLSTEGAVLNVLYITGIKKELEKLSFKEKTILCGYFGVFDYPKQRISALAEEYQLSKSAANKIKSRALTWLREACASGEIGAWRSAVSKLNRVRREGPQSADGALPQSMWCLNKTAEKSDPQE